MCGIENENLHSHIYHSTSLFLEVIDPECDRHRQFLVGTEIGAINSTSNNVFFRKDTDEDSLNTDNRETGNTLTLHLVKGVFSRNGFQSGYERRFSEFSEFGELVDFQEILFFKNT